MVLYSHCDLKQTHTVFCLFFCLKQSESHHVTRQSLRVYTSITSRAAFVLSSSPGDTFPQQETAVSRRLSRMLQTKGFRKCTGAEICSDQGLFSWFLQSFTMCPCAIILLAFIPHHLQVGSLDVNSISTYIYPLTNFLYFIFLNVVFIYKTDIKT